MGAATTTRYMVFCDEVVPFDGVLFLPPANTYGDEWIVIDATDHEDALAQWERRGERVWTHDPNCWGFGSRFNPAPMFDRSAT